MPSLIAAETYCELRSNQKGGEASRPLLSYPVIRFTGIEILRPGCQSPALSAPPCRKNPC